MSIDVKTYMCLTFIVTLMDFSYVLIVLPLGTSVFTFLTKITRFYLVVIYKFLTLTALQSPWVRSSAVYLRYILLVPKKSK